MRVLRFGLVLFLFPGGFPQAAPAVFPEVRQGIEAAKEGGRLIVFLLLDGFSPEGKAIEGVVLDELADFGEEFVIVRCDARSSADQALFKDRFGKDLSKAPVAVVSDANGREITGCYGAEPELYRRMLIHSRIKGGLVEDADEVERLRDELVADTEDDVLVKGIFGIRASDLRRKKVLMTARRTWTYRSGETFEAALLEGKGETGVFVDERGREVEVRFIELSEPDLKFLGTILSGGKTE